ncbi:MAG: hypothetical protein HZC51_09010 [Nitrospirae bacterium]|nr:hypothetical protein [Nitrospirota bacterium]
MKQFGWLYYLVGRGGSDAELAAVIYIKGGRMVTRKTAAIILAGLICLSIAGLFACNERELTKEEIAVKPKELNLPVYDFAQNVKFYNHEDVVRGVSYKVRLPYGPDVTTDMLEFYDSKMQQLGYKPFVEDYYKYADRTWGSFIDGTIEGSQAHS